MRIGKFAQLAEMPVSVLRHYDEEGVLIPEYIDPFTGYRYYSVRQIETVHQITLLKQAGLSLSEIRNILENPTNTEQIIRILDKHEADCRSMLKNLAQAKEALLKPAKDPGAALHNPQGITEETENGEILLKSAPLPLPLELQTFQSSCQLLEEEIERRKYQRISGFMTYGEKDSDTLQIAVKALPLNDEMRPLNEDIHLPFVNDEPVIGKWKVVGEYAVKEDFYADISKGNDAPFGNRDKEIYFLPNGENYWVYSWTKGYLILQANGQSWLSRYELEEYNGKHYMFVENKNYEYRRGGLPTVLVLEQLNHNSYTKRGLAREDDLNLPFIQDERILGSWKSIDYIRTREEFEPGRPPYPQERLYFKKICFQSDGSVTSLYGTDVISGSNMQSWTKGYVLRYFNRTACAYEIVTADETDYLIMEWKSGDYLWGGFDTDYYVFVRDIGI